MKIVFLTPYCPLPINTGARAEIWKHLKILKELGECTILSASSKPVGSGWTTENLSKVQKAGFRVILRENYVKRSLIQYLGIVYASFFKSIGIEKAFGHSNPYHRYAFPAAWWWQNLQEADLAIINYSYWAWLPTPCPKALILHDLLSDRTWEGTGKETKELKLCDLVITISNEETEKLNVRGIINTLCSPPLVEPVDMPASNRIGIVASDNRHNREGLSWILNGFRGNGIHVRVYGRIANCAKSNIFEPVGRYKNWYDPYRECGIILLTTKLGTGVQIKVVEALACGRAIIARRGAMRGLPKSDRAWVEVDTADEMLRVAIDLQRNVQARENLASEARKFYKEHLGYDMIFSKLISAYSKLVAGSFEN